jgi:hypothetical protein
MGSVVEVLGFGFVVVLEQTVGTLLVFGEDLGVVDG